MSRKESNLQPQTERLTDLAATSPPSCAGGGLLSGHASDFVRHRHWKPSKPKWGRQEARTSQASTGWDGVVHRHRLGVRCAAMDPVAGAIAIAGLKYLGPPSLEMVKAFLTPVLAPALNVAGESLGEAAQAFLQSKVTRGCQTLTDASRIVADHNAIPGSVPLPVLMPALAAASLEDDEGLRACWASLLASASMDPDAVPPAYPAILAELAPRDAKALQILYRAGRPGFSTEPIARLFPGERRYSFLVAMENLFRLNLIFSQTPDGDHCDTYEYVSLSTFGAAFMEACAGRRR